MRNVMRISILAGLLALPFGAAAQTPTIGTVTDSGGGALPGNCELYAVKATGSANTDWQAHLFAKGGSGVGLTMPDFDQSSGTYQVLAGNFTMPEAPSHVVAAFVTCPNGQLHFDSGDLSTGFNFMNSAHLQTVGNSYTGNLTIPGDGSGYDVDMGSGAVTFPVIGSDSGGTVGQSINYAFAPFGELNVGDLAWQWGGGAADPGSSIPSGGFIVGYNVYRMADGGSVPDAATLGAMTNFVGFVSMDFDQTVGDGGAAGMDAPADNNAAGDFAGMQNADSAAYTGDEIMLFQDGSQLARDMATAHVAPADPTVAYWYAVQPVVGGVSVADFANVSLVGTPAADYAEDLTGNDTDDWVDLDLDGSPDFYSPNENAGIPGLGLTYGGAPLLSPAALSDPTRLPATEYLGLDVEMDRRGGVSLSLNTALEAGNVLGYNVFRVAGDSRDQVNGSLIAARGGNGNTYEIVDERFSGRRARSLAYEVEVVYNDGTPTATFGPFTAEQTVRGSNRR